MTMAAGALALGAAGCSSTRLHQAQEQFYAGKVEASAKTLDGDVPAEHNRVLYLMERGLIRQQVADHVRATQDWIEAEALSARLDYLSVSRQTASLTVNDSMLPFRGAPYEQVLLNAFAGSSFLAMGRTDDAAVQMRRAIRKLEQRGEYPDSAYTRYMAGFCLALQGDSEGAALQYRTAATLLPALAIDPGTGRIRTAAEASNTVAAATSPMQPLKDTPTRDVVCFIGIGQGPGMPAHWRNNRWGPQPYVRLRAGGGGLGRSQTFADVAALLATTEKVTALKRNAKTATRIVVKEVLASVAENQDELFGGLLRVLLYSLEAPDERRWATLPRWLQVARIAVPLNTPTLTVEFIGAYGTVLESVEAPVIWLGHEPTGFVSVRAL